MNTRQALWLIAGFLLAPLVAGLFSMLFGLIADPAVDDWTPAVQFAVIVSLFSAPVIVVVGVPALALAHRFKFVRWWVAMTLGLTCGALFFIQSRFNQVDLTWLQDNSIELLRFALIGAAPALFVWWFWHLAYTGKPSQDVA